MQDAVACDLARGLAAVADGATDSAFQRLWAELLVAAWVARPPFGESGPEVEEWIAAVRASWRAAVPWAKLPWHGSIKAAETGGLATLLGVVCEACTENCVQVAALAAGDCGLLVLDAAGAMRMAWPLGRSVAFTNTPTLLSSLHPLPDDAWERGLLRETSTILAPGERLLLGTDAVVQWLLRQHEEDARGVAALVSVLEAAAEALPATEWARPERNAVLEADATLAAARAHGFLRNDDLTLLFLSQIATE